MADIRSFTRLSAGLEPAAIASQLTPYFNAIVETVHRHKGLVDKFVGDSVMAVWGVVDVDKAAERAISCASDMVSIANRFQLGSEPIEIGVGLNYGQVFVGNVGGEAKRQFTVLGSVVNLAARYEKASKTLSAPIVMGPAFREQLGPEWSDAVVGHVDIAVKDLQGQPVFSFTPGAQRAAQSEGM